MFLLIHTVLITRGFNHRVFCVLMINIHYQGLENHVNAWHESHFHSCKIEYSYLGWGDGPINSAPDMMYEVLLFYTRTDPETVWIVSTGRPGR